jgi:hypothetical protein
MTQATAQRAANANEEEAQQPGNRPVLKYRHGGLELAVWPNQTENGLMYNTTVSNSYKDEKTGEWKAASSYSPTDLLVLAQFAQTAFADIAKLKQQGRARG